jgi:cell division protein ZapA
MADVRLSIGGHEYIVTCQDGEEPHLLMLGDMVDAKVREAGGAMGGLNESRQLLFASLLLADKLNENTNAAKPQTISPAPGVPDILVDKAAETIEHLASRLEALADRLEN